MILGYLIALYKEKKSGLIFEKEQFEEFIPIPLSLEISDLESQNIEIISELINEKFIINNLESIVAFIPLGKLSSKKVKLITKILSKDFGFNNFVISNNIKDIKNCPIKIIFSTPGEITRYELMIFIQKLFLIDKKVTSGWFHFKDKI